MVPRISLVLASTLLIAAPAAAQRVEAGMSIGYGTSEGITSDQRPLLGQVYDTLDVDSGFAFNFNIGYFFTDKLEAEFLFARQNSRLQADGPSATKAPISELAVYNYMGNIVYNWGERDAKMRPFVFAGIGATQYSFGEFLLPVAGAPVAIDESKSRFASNWGGGVKFYFTPNVGAKVMGRWTPTYLKSDPAGLWCDPFYGCWQLVDNQYSNQFETSFGVTVRF